MLSWKLVFALASLMWALGGTAAHAQYDAIVLGDSPIHYYRFEESDPLFESATDLGTPGGNAGTFTGGVTLGNPSFSPALGSSVRLDGVEMPGTLIDLGLFHPGDAVSVETWINLDPAADKPFHAAVARWDGSYEIDVNQGTGRANFVARNQGNAFALAASTRPIVRGQWHHLVGIFEGGVATIYMDGIQGTSQNIGGTLQNLGPVPDRVLIGATRDAGGVTYTFPAGTIIPRNGSIFVSPNVKAFRARTSGPSGGQGLIVAGAYTGHLSSCRRFTSECRSTCPTRPLCPT